MNKQICAYINSIYDWDRETITKLNGSEAPKNCRFKEPKKAANAKDRLKVVDPKGIWE